MASYRPITDFWILGRCKHKYYGGYPAGFLERARPLLLGAAQMEESVWHIPGGMAAKYNGKRGGITLSGFGKNDVTIDLDPDCNPTLLGDVRHLGDERLWIVTDKFVRYKTYKLKRPRAIIIDRPYTEEDARQYAPGASRLPVLNQLLADCFRLVTPGGRVCVLDYQWPAPPKSMPGVKEIAAICVSTGRNSRARHFTVWMQR